MITITMPAHDAVTIAALVHLTDAKTPQLSGVHLRTALDNTDALASDRFMLGSFNTMATSDDIAEWELTPAACKFLTANVKKLNKWYTADPVRFEIDTDARAVTITAGAARFSYELPQHGNRASLVDTLSSTLERWEPTTAADPVRLGTRFLVKLGKLVDGFTKCETWLIALGANPNNTSRPGPVMATSGGVTVLIQPNLLK